MARPGGAGRHLRRDPADRLQPRAGRPGAEGDVRLGQSGPEGADGGRRAPRARPASSTPASSSGPRINAGGRIGRSDLGARLLSTDDPAEARALAAGARRAERRSARTVEREVLEAAVAAIESERQLRPRRAGASWSPGEGWHPGVIGIVAGRLRERYRKPVVVIGLDPRRRHRQGLRPLAAGRQPRPRGAGGLRRGPAAGRRRPRHGRGPDRAAATPSPEFRAFLCERLAAEMADAPRPRTRWRSTPWSRPARRARPLYDAFQRAGSRSARAIRSRCSRSPTCASSG